MSLDEYAIPAQAGMAFLYFYVLDSTTPVRTLLLHTSPVGRNGVNLNHRRFIFLHIGGVFRMTIFHQQFINAMN